MGNLHSRQQAQRVGRRAPVAKGQVETAGLTQEAALGEEDTLSHHPPRRFPPGSTQSGRSWE